MEMVSASLDKEDVEKLVKMVNSGEAANVSHAVRMCIKAFKPKLGVEAR